MTTAAASEMTIPADLIRAAVQELCTSFIEPLEPAQLFTEAWEGASRALARAGAPTVPPPAYPRAWEAACVLHTESFPLLEHAAAGWLTPLDLATAALKEMADRRLEGHTLAITPGLAQFLALAFAGTLRLFFGLVFSDRPPLHVVDVVPGSPAYRAGLRRGQEVVSINGWPAAGLRRLEAVGLLNWRPARSSRVVVCQPDGQPQTITLVPEQVAPVSRWLLPSKVGVIRFDTFTGADALLAELRAALTEFEHAGAQGWVIDLRTNIGWLVATAVAAASLVVSAGRLFRIVQRSPTATEGGSVLPPEHVFEADGSALPFQRPLALLIGPGSQSGAELFAVALQTLGRATLVGEQTVGWVSSGRVAELPGGVSLFMTVGEGVIGPNERRLMRVGVSPDIAVTPTPADEAAGRDVQLEAAVHLLTQHTAGRAAP